MMGNWKTCTISDLGTVVGGATPSTKKAENYDGGTIAWITPKDLAGFSGRFISHGERNITEQGLKSCSSQLMPAHTILFSSRAPIGYIAIAEQEVCTNQGFKSVIPNEDTDYMFLYYLLKYSKDKIENLGSGTTFKEVSGSTMRNIEMSVPESVEEQHRIASVLSALDDKIEKNMEINDNLEEQAQAIYRSLFVTYDHFSSDRFYDSDIGRIPPGWTIKLLSEVTESVRTKVNNNNYKVFSAINTGKLQLSEDYFTKQVFSKDIGKYIVVEPHDFAYNPARINIGSIGLNLFGYTGCVSPVYVVVHPEPEYYYFLDFFFKSKRFSEEVKTRASGSVRQSLNYTDFGLIKIAYPPINVVRQFNYEYESRLNTIRHNEEENNKLSAIRDALLPRLMSGELDVSDIDL